MTEERWLTHNFLFIGLGIALAVCLGIAHENPFCLPAVALTLATMGYLAALSRIPLRSPWRLGVDYGYALGFYAASPWFIEKLHRPIMNESLLSWDTELFGQTPAVALESFSTPWFTELLSAAYLSYLIYLHVALIHASYQTWEIRRHLTSPLFSAMAIGFGCYVLIPAETPLTAHPDLFVKPAPTGGAVTSLSAAIHESAAAKYDVFPSLHVLNTLILLAFDWRHVRRRFRIMLAPAALMLVATLALRFHYGIDLLASLVIFAALAISLPELRANLVSKRPKPKLSILP